MNNMIAFLIGWGVGAFIMAFALHSMAFVALGVVMWVIAFVLDKNK